MKLIVGLGNKGKAYENTRHNIGFLCVDAFVKEFEIGEWKPEKKFFGQVAYGHFKNEKVIVLKPDTYMNLSGKAVQAIQQFYKIEPENICVFFDDVDLSFGTIRFREKGGSGGHNGVKSLISVLGESFKRIKIGVKNPLKDQRDTADFVLGQWTKEEQESLLEIQKKAIDMYLEHQS